MDMPRQYAWRDCGTSENAWNCADFGPDHHCEPHCTEHAPNTLVVPAEKVQTILTRILTVAWPHLPEAERAEIQAMLTETPTPAVDALGCPG